MKITIQILCLSVIFAGGWRAASATHWESVAHQNADRAVAELEHRLPNVRVYSVYANPSAETCVDFRYDLIDGRPSLAHAWFDGEKVWYIESNDPKCTAWTTDYTLEFLERKY